MARISPTDPVFKAEGVLQFTPDLEEPLLFKSLLPGATYGEAFEVPGGPGFQFSLADLNKLGDEYIRDYANDDSGIASFILNSQSALSEQLQRLARLEIVQSLRGVIGQVATTTGFLRATIQDNVAKVYGGTLSAVSQAVSFLNGVINNGLVQAALDGITFIPVVGWVIRVVAEVLKLAVRIAVAVRRARLQKIDMKLAKRHYVPMLRGDQDLQNATNELMAQQVMQRVKDFAMWSLFMPPFRMPSSPRSGRSWSDYWTGIEAKEDPQAKGGAEAWYLFGNPAGGMAPAFGMGWCPGTSSLFRTLEFTTGTAGNPPRDVGDYFTTARTMCSYLWSTVLSPGPSMFTVNTEDTRREWDNYVHGMMMLGLECVSKGFTTSDSASGFCSDTYLCTQYNSLGKWPGKDNAKPWGCYDKNTRLNRTLPIAPSLGPAQADRLIRWLEKQFWGRGPDQDRFPFPFRETGTWDPEKYIYENSVYAHALKNLKSRQDSMVRGWEAFEVHPANTEEGPNNSTIRGIESDGPYGGIYRAFKDKAMRDRWENTVREIVNNPTLLAHVSYRDIPQYRYKGESLHEYVKAKKLERVQMLAMPTGRKPPLPGGPSDFPPPSPPTLAGQGTEAGIGSLGVNPEVEMDRLERAPSKEGVGRSFVALGAATVAAGAAISLTPALERRVRGRST